MAKSGGMPSTWRRDGAERGIRRLAMALACMLGAAGGAIADDDASCPVPAGAAVVPVTVAANGLVTDEQGEVVLAGVAPLAADPMVDGTARFVAGRIGQAFRLVPTAPSDRYGRVAGLAFEEGGGLLQADLVRSGMAVVRPDQIEEDCARGLLALESAARSARRGLWAEAASVWQAADDTSLLERNGLYALVEGRIVSVGYGSRMVFLDFGRIYRTDFTVMVQEPLVSRLREAGIPVESLAGRQVRVRGVIEESGGPAIRLASPLALELVDPME